MFAAIRPTAAEVAEPRAGDAVVASPDVVMDRAFTVPGTPDQVWPWLAQLGKRRAGWYLPAAVARVVPARHRALRRLEPRWQDLAVGQVVPDYGGRDASFTVDELDPPRTLVYRSVRGRTTFSWSIVLRPVGGDGPARTRVLLRLRMSPVKRRWLAESAGGFFDALTVAGLAAGLRERTTTSGASADA